MTIKEPDSAEPPGPPDLVLIGRRRAALRPLLSIVFLVTILCLVLSDSWIGPVIVLALFLEAIWKYLRWLLFPPSIELRDRRFFLRRVAPRPHCPANNVQDIYLDDTSLRVVFRTTDAVDPPSCRRALDASFTKRGIHLQIDDAFFTREDVEAARTAMGLGERVDQPGPATELKRTLTRLTPHVVVTPALIVLNIAIFVLMIASGVHVLLPSATDLIAWGADHAPHTLRGEWWRLLTCAFVHGGFIHLLINMWVLWSVGPFVERLLGHVGFLIVYICSALFGSIVSLMFLTSVSVGASGAIFGVFGALFACVLRRRERFPRESYDRILFNGVAFLVINVILGISVPVIDVAAHAGGLIGGFLCGLMLSRPLAREPDSDHSRRIIAAGTLSAGAVAVLILAMEPLYVTGLEIRKRVQGLEHPHTLRTMDILAHLYAHQGRTDDVRPLVRVILEVGRRRAERPDASANDKNSSAWALLTSAPADLRDPAAALPLALAANEMTRYENPDFLDTLSLAYHLTGDTERAIENQKKALALVPPGDSATREALEAALADFESALDND